MDIHYIKIAKENIARYEDITNKFIDASPGYLGDKEKIFYKENKLIINTIIDLSKFDMDAYEENVNEYINIK